MIWAASPLYAQDFGDDFAGEFDSASPATGGATGLNWSGSLTWEQGGHFGVPSANPRQWVLDQTRFRMKTQESTDMGKINVNLDFVQDGVRKSSYLDVREAKITTTPFSWLDIAIGKQVNTWGVGDMVFINDLFPKNWMGMFLGRDMEFMKDPANSVRTSAYMGPVTVELVGHPQFAPDTTPNGCVFAVYNPASMLDSSKPVLASNASACGADHAPELKDGQYKNGEFAGRISMKLGGYDLAAYGYSGFYKNPKGMTFDATTGSLTPRYPRLSASGASLEGQLGPGIVSMEAGRYLSLEDRKGLDPLTENSMVKSVVGYRMDMTASLSLGAQVYQEQMENYSQYEQGILGMYQSMGLSSAQAASQPGYLYRKEEVQRTYTLRATVKAQQETLWVSFFGYQRPQDRDSYVKLDITKNLSTKFKVAFGANVFDGNKNYQDREFGMLANEDNAYLRVQYNY